MEAKQLLALDVGAARSGIARASSIAKLAEPLKTVKTDDLIEVVQQLIQENPTELVVVGLPRSLKGDDTGQTAWVREWVTKVKDKFEAPLYWQDEALTSVAAEGLKSKGPKDVDAMAAAIILQDFLDTPEADRMVC